MSLINQALKKAQRIRPEDASTRAAPKGYTMGLRPTHTESQPTFKALHWVVGGGILVAGIVAAVALTIVLMSPKPEPISEPPGEGPVRVQIALPQQTVKPVTDAADSITPILPKESPADPPADAPSIVYKGAGPVSETEKQAHSPKEPAPAASSEPVPEEARPVMPEPVTEQPVRIGKAEEEDRPPPPPPEPLPGAQPDPTVLAFLKSSRISGVKVAGVHSRLLMNNQIYKVGDTAQPETQLRITEIKNNEVLFVDESGIQYRKQFRR